ncbi:hypothetical protein Q5O89_17125 [Peribacillus frigoritolerans]|nr:hypothetical protein [Peribacillus frigoritolerans]
MMTSILTSSGNLAGIIAPLLTGYIISLAGGNQLLGYNLSILFMAILVLAFGILFAIFVKPAGKLNNKSSDNFDLKSS